MHLALACKALALHYKQHKPAWLRRLRLVRAPGAAAEEGPHYYDEEGVGVGLGLTACRQLTQWAQQQQGGAGVESLVLRIRPGVYEFRLSHLFKALCGQLVELELDLEEGIPAGVMGMPVLHDCHYPALLHARLRGSRRFRTDHLSHRGYGFGLSAPSLLSLVLSSSMLWQLPPSLTSLHLTDVCASHQAATAIFGGAAWPGMRAVVGTARLPQLPPAAHDCSPASSLPLVNSARLPPLSNAHPMLCATPSATALESLGLRRVRFLPSTGGDGGGGGGEDDGEDAPAPAAPQAPPTLSAASALTRLTSLTACYVYDGSKPYGSLAPDCLAVLPRLRQLDLAPARPDVLSLFGGQLSALSLRVGAAAPPLADLTRLTSLHSLAVAGTSHRATEELESLRWAGIPRLLLM